MTTRHGSAFTRVELLVMVVFLGSLLGLALVAIAPRCDGGNKTDSANNLMVISKGIQIYESRKQRYPGYLQQYRPAQEAIPALNGSWVVAILPYIGRQDLYDAWADEGGERPDEQTTIPTLICPGDDQPTSEGPGLSYVVNTGIPDSPAETRAHGIFFDHRAAVANKVVVNSGDIQRRDGLANTLLVGENVRAYRWNGRTDCESAPCPQEEYMLGFVWEPASATRPINQTQPDGTLDTRTATSYAHARLNSPHPGGAMVAFADGHVIYLSESIDVEVYNKLCTPDGAAVSPPQTKLDATDYVR